MREIIQIQIGKCGNGVGNEIWKELMREHGVDHLGQFYGESTLQSQHMDVFFNEVDVNRYVPRSVLVDLDPSNLDTIALSDLGGFFAPQNIISGKNGAANNWAKGYFEGRDILEDITEIFHREIEMCDRIQAFQIIHSVIGGAGSGLASLIVSALRQEYPNTLIATHTIFPSTVNTASASVQCYNSLLGSNSLILFADMCFAYDNDALLRICSTKPFEIHRLDFADFNSLIAKTVCGTTCGTRFPGQLNSNLRKLATNLIPFPRLHFFVTASTQLAHDSRKLSHVETSRCIRRVFDPKQLMCSIEPRAGISLASECILRGRLSNLEADELLGSKSSSPEYVDWLPNNCVASVCDIAPRHCKMSVTLVSNTTSIQSLWRQISREFGVLFRRKAFLHWFTSEGMEEMEMTEAAINIEDLLSEYEHYQLA